MPSEILETIHLRNQEAAAEHERKRVAAMIKIKQLRQRQLKQQDLVKAKI